jgi:integrase
MVKPRAKAPARRNPYVDPRWHEKDQWKGISKKDVQMLDHFLAYLVAQEYTEMSVYKHWGTVRRGVVTGNPLSLLDAVGPDGRVRTKATLHQARFALECWAEFLKASGAPDVGDLVQERIAQWVVAKKTTRRGGRGRHRKVVKVGMPTEQWRALRKHVAETKSGPDATVVQMLLRTGLRISDVMRIPRAAVEEGLRVGEMQLRLKGDKLYPYPVEPIRAQLEELLAHNGWEQVYQLVTKGNLVAGGQAVRRRLKSWASEIGIEDVYPHKVRRTTITEVDERHGIKVAKQIAGHEDEATTRLYTKRLQPTDRVGAKLTDVLDEE